MAHFPASARLNNYRHTGSPSNGTAALSQRNIHMTHEEKKASLTRFIEHVVPVFA